MKKLEIWRRTPVRDGSPAATPEGAETAAKVAEQQPSRPACHADEVDDTLKALRQAGMLQHEDTVPAAFYRASGD